MSNERTMMPFSKDLNARDPRGAARPAIGRLVIGAVCLLGVLCTLLAVGAGSASAEVTHQLLFTFNGSDTPAGSLGIPLTIAADTVGSDSGDVWVGSISSFTAPGLVSQFSSGGSYTGTQITGTPSGSFGLLSFSLRKTSSVAVDNSGSANSGDLYIADIKNGAVDRFTASGTYLCQITGSSTPSATECNGAAGSATPAGSMSPGGLAVAANGDLYVGDVANDVIDEFGPAGNYLGQITSTYVTAPESLAIDSSGNLYIANGGAFGAQNVVELDPTGTFIRVVDTNSPYSVAVDPATDHVYVAENGSTAQIAEYDPSGALLDTFGAGQIGSVPGLAVGANGDVYAADTAGRVDVFGPRIVIPNVTTGQVTSPGETTATLSGTVDPDTADGGGNVTSCQFEYTAASRYSASASDPYSGGGTASCSPATPYSTVTSVQGSVSGLTPDTQYDYTLEASNSNGVLAYGQNQTFATSGPPTIDSASSEPNPTDATLHAQVNPWGLSTTCAVQYVTDAEYQSSGYGNAQSTPCSSGLGSGFGDQTATASLSGLSLNTTYHFRFVATNSAGTTDGADHTFMTWGVSSFSVAATAANGQPYTQAGGHPWALTTSFTLAQTPDQFSPAGDLKDVNVALPAGMIGNPTAVPECTQQELLSHACPLDSQVGTLIIANLPVGSQPFPGGLFNMVPPPGVPAEFAGYIGSQALAMIDAKVRTGSDYGIDAASMNISTFAGALTGVAVTMWGAPADPSHTPERCEQPNYDAATGGVICANTDPPGNTPTPSTSADVPFLTMPTSCSGSLTASLQVDSYQDPGAYAVASQSLPADTGCDALSFTPSLSVQPTTGTADSPSGLSVDLRLPQNSNPSGLAEAYLKDATVTLPAGVSVDPSAAHGLTGCTPAEIGIDSASAPSCPDSSKVGSVEVDSPLLRDPLRGGIYVAQQSNNPFGSLLAIYVTAYADGVWVKLAGHVVADPKTGQLTTTFSDNPQLPFSNFKLDFFGGSQGILATPQQCGTYTSTSDLSPWSGGADATPSDSFQVTSGCVSGFKPMFTAGSENPQAGAYSPFVLSMSRPDTSQNFKGLSVKLPPGMLAKLAGVGECTDAQLATISSQPGTGAAQAANPSCPADSQVGTVTAGSGVGPDPFFLGGKVYLTGPYKGAPYGLAVVVPAVAGPYDLGSVVVREALEINPTTAQVTDVSDPFPTILHGIPLDIRRIDVVLNRPGFTINPTSCDVMAISGTLTSTLGINAPVSSRFQVGGCASLGFSPKLSMKLTGKGRTRSGDHPNLIATLTQPHGQANIHNVRVALPLSMALDPNNSQHVCPYAVAQAVTTGPANCPASTLVGHATAITPLLSQPLSGPVYLVQGIRMQNGVQVHTLPSLLIPLRGQIALDLRAQTSVSHGKLVTTFPTIPDAPVSKFTLTINGGKKGILVITGRGRSICGFPQVTQANLIAQNGKAEYPTIKMGTPCRTVHHHRRTKHSKRKHRK